MRLQRLPGTAGWGVLCLLFLCPPVTASYFSLPWDNLVLRADLVGIVECETAGEIVARYKVIESWKGPPPDSYVTIDTGAGYYGDQVPIALVGERYLVIAFAGRAPSTLVSASSHGAVPLWWRRVPADYSLPYPQGRCLLPVAKGKWALSEIGAPHKDVDSFKRAALPLLTLDPDHREARLLLTVARSYRGSFGRLARRLPDDTPTRVVVTRFLALAKREPEDWWDAVRELLQWGGRTETLRTLQDLSEDAFPSGPDERRGLIAALTNELSTVRKAEGHRCEEAPAPSPSQGEIESLRRVVLEDGSEVDRWEAFDILTRADPTWAASFLRTWEKPNRPFSDPAAGYVIGSCFAVRCGGDRAGNLRTLLDAKDPFVRVAAAIYLSFEEPAEGTRHLREFARLAGDPGVWAALNLVRRGVGSALPRALEVLESPARHDMEGSMHLNLQARVRVLTSNIAKRSGVPQPSPPPPLPDEALYAEYEYGDLSLQVSWYKELYRSYLLWWSAHHESLVAQDPWFEEIRKQKID